MIIFEKEILFGNIKWLWMIQLIFILTVFIVTYVFWRQKKVYTQLAAPRWQTWLLGRYLTARRIAKFVFRFLGITFLCLAVLRPQWDKKEVDVKQSGRDLLIAIDVSRSMLASDCKPNRLELVKEKVKKLLYNLECERVGLILFSGTSVVQCPLTKDYHTFFMFLDQVDTEIISTGTTALYKPIEQAVSIFTELGSFKTKLLLLFTDGEDFAGSVSGVQDKIQEVGLSIITVGVGTSHGAPIPVLDDSGQRIGFEKDESGGVIMSQLNELLLQDIATQSHGKYIHAQENSEQDIKDIISMIQKFEKNEYEDQAVQYLQDQYVYPAAIAFIALLVEWML